MLVADLLHSCANERVAAAAISSIGGLFECHLESVAKREGVTAGAVASRLVRAFAATASERDWRELHGSFHGQDLPVLAGLQAIVARESRKRSGNASTLPIAA